MAWFPLLRRCLAARPPRLAPVDDAIGETLRDAVREHTRVKADNARCYEARVQAMMTELFLRMGEGHARFDS